MPYTEPEVVTNTVFENVTPYGNSQFKMRTYRSYRRTLYSGVSPRVNGKLVKRSNSLGVTQYEMHFFPSFSRSYSWEGGKRQLWEVYSASMNFDEPYGHYDTNQEVYPDNAALVKLYSKISDTKASMAVTFAERQATLDMIGNTATNLFKAVRSAKKGNWRQVSRHLGVKYKKPRSRQTSSAWLEYQYGWYPMVLDVYILSNLQDLFAGGTVKSSAREVITYKKGSTNVNAELRSRYACTILVTDPAIAFSNQIGLVNPATVAWELVPFSFVVDWFLPVGDYLDSLTATVGMSVKDISRSQKIVRSHYRDSVNRPDGQYETRRSDAMYGTSSHYSRTPLTSLPKLNLSFKNPLSVEHLVSAIALGRSVKKDL